eukprot:8577156-Pyramimonas_sp.AAC.1
MAVDATGKRNACRQHWVHGGWGKGTGAGLLMTREQDRGSSPPSPFCSPSFLDPLPRNPSSLSPAPQGP